MKLPCSDYGSYYRNLKKSTLLIRCIRCVGSCLYEPMQYVKHQYEYHQIAKRYQCPWCLVMGSINGVTASVNHLSRCFATLKYVHEQSKVASRAIESVPPVVRQPTQEEPVVEFPPSVSPPDETDVTNPPQRREPTVPTHDPTSPRTEPDTSTPSDLVRRMLPAGKPCGQDCSPLHVCGKDPKPGPAEILNLHFRLRYSENQLRIKTEDTRQMKRNYEETIKDLRNHVDTLKRTKFLTTGMAFRDVASQC